MVAVDPRLVPAGSTASLVTGLEVALPVEEPRTGVAAPLTVKHALVTIAYDGASDRQ